MPREMSACLSAGARASGKSAKTPGLAACRRTARTGDSGSAIHSSNRAMAPAIPVGRAKRLRFAISSPILTSLPDARQAKTAILGTLAEELVALQRGRTGGFGGVAHHLADAVQTHVYTRSRDLGQRDQVLDRLAHLDASM